MATKGLETGLSGLSSVPKPLHHPGFGVILATVQETPSTQFMKNVFNDGLEKPCTSVGMVEHMK